ncbi:MAG: Co2+/Mg2+ efflux protein ApaG [Pseudomonadota bacterium]
MQGESPYNISVDVKTAYISEQSDPATDRYVFAYTIRIQNRGSLPARLLTRHWIITNANGSVQEVHGEGVVGEQPYLGPGQAFEYTSGTILDTPVGSMRGTYHMLADDGKTFDAPIPVFTLSHPHMLH